MFSIILIFKLPRQVFRDDLLIAIIKLNLKRQISNQYNLKCKNSKIAQKGEKGTVEKKEDFLLSSI